VSNYSVHEAKTHLSKLIAAALEGQEVIVQRGAHPIVRIVPLAPPERRIFGAFKGQIAMDSRLDDPLPDDELRAWNGK
jgi:prevent-host-death family protein